MRPRKKSQADLEQEASYFNYRFPVGTKVLLRRDDGTLQETVVRDPAFILSGHTVVAFFEGISGAYLASRAQAVPT